MFTRIPGSQLNGNTFGHVTGYLGGAIATHARIGDPAFVSPLFLGILAWAGLYLRDDRLRQLLPLRQTRTP